MNASWHSFAALADKFPEERSAIARLRELVLSGKNGQYTFTQLVDQLQPTSTRNIALIVSMLVGDGILRNVFRVVTPQGDPLGEFESLPAIPRWLSNERTDETISVGLNNVVAYYILPTSRGSESRA